MNEKHSFWSTVPGMLTGIAAIITAIGGLLVVLLQTGILGDKEIDTVLPGNVVQIPDGVDEPKDSRVPKINLLSSKNGGQILAATSDQWLKTIDGEQNDFAFYESNLGAKTEGVYAFEDERPAQFDTFTVLILETRDSNLKDFELLWGNESATGKFHSIGKFQTQNMKLFRTPYQEFKFPPVTAKYLKVRLLSTWVYALIDAREFQLWGSLQ